VRRGPRYELTIHFWIEISSKLFSFAQPLIGREDCPLWALAPFSRPLALGAQTPQSQRADIEENSRKGGLDQDFSVSIVLWYIRSEKKNEIIASLAWF
jgi:hypothetical protein